MEYTKKYNIFPYILTSPLKLKVEYSRTFSLKSETMMMVVAKAGNKP